MSKTLEVYDNLLLVQKVANLNSLLSSVTSGAKNVAGKVFQRKNLPYLPAAGVGSYLTEATGRSLAGGEFAAPTTFGALTGGLNAVLGGTGITPLLSSAGKSVGDGVLNSAGANNFLHGINSAASKLNSALGVANDTIKDPNKTLGMPELRGASEFVEGVKANDMARLDQAGQQFMGGAVGKSVKDIFTDPVAVGGMALTGLIPAVGYDLYTRKRREQEAKVNKNILKALTKKKEVRTPSVKIGSINWNKLRFGPAGVTQMDGKRVMDSLGKGKDFTPESQQVMEGLQKYKPWNPLTWGIQQSPPYNQLTMHPWRTLAIGGGLGGMSNYLRDAKTPESTGEAMKTLGMAGLEGLRRGPGAITEFDLELSKKMHADGAFTLPDSLGKQNLNQVVDNLKTVGTSFGTVKDNLQDKWNQTKLPIPSNDLGGFEKYKGPLKILGGTALLAGVPALLGSLAGRYVRRKEKKDRREHQQLLTRL